MLVDPADPAFQHPTKPIGPFYTADQAKALEQTKGYAMAEDSGRGWRRVVPSPKPKRIAEIGTIKTLWDTTVTIACGGGGVPVVEQEDGTLTGVAAVIDKDLAACELAREMEADVLMILTEVPAVAINFGQPDQQDLGEVTAAELEQYAADGQFGVGSMLPKVQAAVNFVRSAPGRTAVITSLDLGGQALSGRAGTRVRG
jgi:carbamate kinase